MERIMIYPYSKECEPYVKHQNLLNDMEISAIVSPKGWGMEDDSIYSLQGTMKVKCDFSEYLNESTAVWFVEDAHLELPENLLWEKLEEAVSQSRKIIYTRYKNKLQYEKAMELIPKHLNITPSMITIPQIISVKNSCYDIETPVLAIFGLEENTDKFEIQLTLKEKLTDRGYRITSITSRRESELLNVHAIPAFMFDKELSETDKIIQYNHYVKAIELSENPDLIIIGVPGGVLPYDNINHNNYGITAYEISFAIPCDASIMCITYNDNFTGDYSDAKRDIHTRLGFDIIGCHIAAVMVDTHETLDDGNRSFVTIERDLIRKRIKSYNKKDIYDLISNDYMEVIVNDIINKLTEYSE